MHCCGYCPQSLTDASPAWVQRAWPQSPPHLLAFGWLEPASALPVLVVSEIYQQQIMTEQTRMRDRAAIEEALTAAGSIPRESPCTGITTDTRHLHACTLLVQPSRRKSFPSQEQVATQRDQRNLNRCSLSTDSSKPLFWDQIATGCTGMRSPSCKISGFASSLYTK